MAEFKWNKKLETGIDLIDSQHKELFTRIYKLELAILTRKEYAELERLIEYLESYVSEHFQAEEDIMKRINYPDLIAHQEEHKKFTSFYNNLKKESLSKGIDTYLALDVDKQIRKWWENHVLKTDMAYVPHLKENELLLW
jgi:hemerythrin